METEKLPQNVQGKMLRNGSTDYSNNNTDTII